MLLADNEPSASTGARWTAWCASAPRGTSVRCRRAQRRELRLPRRYGPAAAVRDTPSYGKVDPNGGGSNRKAIISQCEESLRRLKTDYIDLYWLHAWDKTTPIEETMRALDTLVEQGKVRYLGFSDTPAWKVAQAQTMATLRGWSPLIALQIEYSLLQRTVEGELVPMAQELGLGITPWGPLRGGALSGKYRRADKGKHQAGRGARVTTFLDDRTFDLLEIMEGIAKELGTTVPRIALSWIQNRPGVTSTIIGARTMEQLEDNVGSLLSLIHI